MDNFWRIWFEIYDSNGKKVGAGVSLTGYKYKQNAYRAAKKLYGNRPEEIKYKISIENPFTKDTKLFEFALAVCEIPVYETEFAVVVKMEDKNRAEEEMSLAYECWHSEDEEMCILPGYDINTIGQACYGDFIVEWLRSKNILCNEDIGLVPLDTYCHAEPPEDCEDENEWRDNRITTYWLKKCVLEEYLKKYDTTVDEYLKTYTYDDVECDVLHEGIPYVCSFTA